MRKRGEVWPEPSPEYLRTLPEDLAEALKQVYAVLDYPHPVTMFYSTCYVSRERMEQVLWTPYPELTSYAVDELLLNGGFMAARWQDLAYFVPRRLEGYLKGTYDSWLIFAYLLRAAHAHEALREEWQHSPLAGRPMPAPEREVLFRFFGEALRYWTETVPASIWEERTGRVTWLLELLSFLAAFDRPLAPILRRWRDCGRPEARVLVSLVLATLVTRQSEEGDGDFPPQIWPYRSRPENTEALQELLEPGAVMEYLTSNTAHFWMLDGPHEVSLLEVAFDMASFAQ